jgi:hypothetical protein
MFPLLTFPEKIQAIADRLELALTIIAFSTAVTAVCTLLLLLRSRK